MRWDGEDYQGRFDAIAADGGDVHGEATLVATLVSGGASVLDAGCGTGRVGIELAARGCRVTGVDVDRSMLEAARRRAPAIEWIECDLAALQLGRSFDAVVMAGNVLLFTRAGTEAAVVAGCASHVAIGGALIAGFQLGGSVGLASYDTACSEAGLALAERWATWDRAPWPGDGGYAVSVHRRSALTATA
ncbi:MAG: class I SAM-dependent methyltransferase [Acidimicrobiales bacterium]